MKIIVISFILLCTGIFSYAMDNEFIMHEICNNYSEGMEIFSIDFDDDGDFDLLSAGTQCILWLNDGVGNFSETLVYTNPSWPRSIRAADLDDDGDNDIVIAALASNQVVLLENTGTGFNVNVLDNSLILPHTIDLKDLDSDGDIDVLCSEFDNSNALSEVVWWRNDGNLDFSDKIIISEIFQQSPYVFADFINSDDDMDVVACCEVLNDVVWWENDGNQNFGTGHMIDNNFFRTHTVVGNDLDLDGDVDILGAACVGGLLAWWDNDGEGNFTRNDIDSFGGALWMDCADFDNDGDNDLFAVGQGPDTAYIYENIGDEVFEEYPLPGLFEDGFSATAQDFDNDGDMDLAAIGRSSGQICWWENKYYGANFGANYLSGNIPLQVDFTDQSNFQTTIDSWAWDFNNDGTIDSNEQDPTWTYTESGTYSISLEVTFGANSALILKEDMITVFNGHTALEFNEQLSRIVCSAENSINITETFSVEAWIYPYSYGPDANFGLGRILDKAAVSIFLSNGFPLYPAHCLVLQMDHADGVMSSCATSENSILLNEWTHIAVSYDGVDQVRMFVNGEDVISSQPTAPTGILEDNSENDLYLGNLSWFNRNFDGIIDEVRVWDHFMDQPEVQENMNKYLHGWESGLIHYWQFSEGNGEIAFDAAGNNDGSIFGASWFQGIELDPVGAEQINIALPKIDLKCYPNPFNPVTNIAYSIKDAGKVAIEVYNIKGQHVKTLVNEVKETGDHVVIWDGTDDNDHPVASGIYLSYLKSANNQISKKMLLIK